MSRRPKDLIPHEILNAAKQAGEPTPLWYAGRTNGHEAKPVEPSAHDVILEGRREAGVHEEPELPPLGPPVADPFADD
jgi:hypothetical protein